MTATTAAPACAAEKGKSTNATKSVHLSFMKRSFLSELLI
jgi:hypothetical protein